MQEKNKSYEKKTKFRIRRIRFYSAKVTSIQKSPQITHRTHEDSSQSRYPYHTHTHGNPHTHGSPASYTGLLLGSLPIEQTANQWRVSLPVYGAAGGCVRVPDTVSTAAAATEFPATAMFYGSRNDVMMWLIGVVVTTTMFPLPVLLRSYARIAVGRRDEL